MLGTSATSEVPVALVTPGGDLLSEMLKTSVSSGAVSGSMTVLSERFSASSTTGDVVSSAVSTLVGVAIVSTTFLSKELFWSFGSDVGEGSDGWLGLSDELESGLDTFGSVVRSGSRSGKLCGRSSGELSAELRSFGDFAVLPPEGACFL